jgi:hypothetical protein
MKAAANIFLALVLGLGGGAIQARGVYQEPEAFLDDAFSGATPKPQLVWLTGERRAMVKELLGHDYASLRVRYWRSQQRSAWILEEIGKEQPITVGLVVNDGRLEQIRVLVFRESRGWEIRHPFFTGQFENASLDNGKTLDRRIDGISGATLSVRAMKKLATLALYLDAETSAENVPSSP